MNPTRWDAVRAMPTVVEEIPSQSRGVHESVTRAYQILEIVKDLLARGDSATTIAEFIQWAETREGTTCAH